jgi:hypothetical protein
MSMKQVVQEDRRKTWKDTKPRRGLRSSINKNRIPLLPSHLPSWFLQLLRCELKIKLMNLCALECNNTNTLTSSIFLIYMIKHFICNEYYTSNPWPNIFRVSLVEISSIVKENCLSPLRSFKRNYSSIHLMRVITIVTLPNPPPILKIHPTRLQMNKHPPMHQRLDWCPLWLKLWIILLQSN